MLQLHRIFCATPWELEAERDQFYRVIGEFNESAGLARGILFVPVSLNCVRDKRPLQYVIDENIRECRHYILVHTGNWGPVERNFHYDYCLALESLANRALPMTEIATLRRAPRPNFPLEPDFASMPAPNAEFQTPEEFRQCLLDLCARWLNGIS